MKETEKQLEYIRFIEEETGITYNGKKNLNQDRSTIDNES